VPNGFPSNSMNTWVSDPSQTMTMGPSTLVLRKELTGYGNYGADGYADVVYEASRGLDLPGADSPSPPHPRDVISADDHPEYAIDLYGCDIWANSTCVFSGQVPANHGRRSRVSSTTGSK